MATRYHFITQIELSSSGDTVWETLARSEEWAEWWRWLRAVEVLNDGDSEGVGRRVRHKVSSPLRYRLTYVGFVTQVAERTLSRFEAEGDLEGRGQFRLETTDAGTTLITFDWLVETPKAWMNFLAPLARPIFVWNHHRLMEAFAEDLASTTGGRLLRVTNESLDPDDEGFFKMPSFKA
jgi:hypothetical protein